MSAFTSGRGANGSSVAPPAHLSVLACGLQVTGDVVSDGTVTIEGQLDGVIRGSSQVVVAPGGVVVGDEWAYEVLVSGRIEGDITATRRVELKPGGQVMGDVTAPNIVVHEGVEVNGRFTIEPVEIPDIPADPACLTA